MTRLRTRLFQCWFRVSRPMTLGVRGIVVNEAEEVLLIRHTYTPGWYFPGGGVERGETCETALSRELAEEGGVALTEAPRLLGVFSNHANFRNDHVLLYEVPASAWQTCASDNAGEIAELGWFAPTDPPEGITRGTAARLREWRENLPHPAHW